MNSDKIGQELGDILINMAKAKNILTGIHYNYDCIREDRHNKGMNDLCDSDRCLQDSLMSINDAIMYIKHKINMLGDIDE